MTDQMHDVTILQVNAHRAKVFVNTVYVGKIRIDADQSRILFRSSRDAWNRAIYEIDPETDIANLADNQLDVFIQEAIKAYHRYYAPKRA
jgi:hypothetical protein